jgi:WD40 repeat protein
MLVELKNAETALSGPSAFQQYHRPILAELYHDYVQEHGRDEKTWNLPELRQWLEQERGIHPYRAEAIVYGMCDTRIDGWNQLLVDLYPTGRGAEALAMEAPVVELSDEATMESEEARRPRTKPPKLPPMPPPGEFGAEPPEGELAAGPAPVPPRRALRFFLRLMLIAIALVGVFLACVAAAALLAIALESWDGKPPPDASRAPLAPEARRQLREARFAEATDLVLQRPPDFDAALERLEATCSEFPRLQGLQREYALSAWCYANQGKWPDTWRCYRQARIRLGPAKPATAEVSHEAQNWLADVRHLVYLSTAAESSKVWRDMGELERRLGGTLNPPEQLESLFERPDQPGQWTGELNRLVVYRGEVHLLVILVQPEHGMARIEAVTDAADFAGQIRDYRSAAECGMGEMVSVKGTRLAPPERTPDGSTMPTFRLDPEAMLIQLDSVHRVGEPSSLAEVGRQLRTAFRQNRESTELARYLQAPPEPGLDRTIQFDCLVASFSDVTEAESEAFARTLHVKSHPDSRRVAEVVITDGSEVEVPDVGIGDRVSIEAWVVRSGPAALVLEAAAIRPLLPEDRAEQAAAEPSPMLASDAAEPDGETAPEAAPGDRPEPASMVTDASERPDAEALTEGSPESETASAAESQPEQPRPDPLFQVDTGQGPIHQVAWSPDDSYVATAGDETAKIWEPWRGEVVRTCGERTLVTDIAWYPSSSNPRQILLAVGCADANIRIFDVAAERTSPSRYVQTGSPVCCLAWSRDGETLAAGLESGEFVLSKSVDGETVQRRTSSSFHTITSIAWHPRESRLLVTGDEEGLIWIWDLKRMAPLHGRIDRQLDSFRGMVTRNADLRRLITTGSLQLVDRPVSRCDELAWSPDGGQIAAVENGGEIWDFHQTRGLHWSISLPPAGTATGGPGGSDPGALGSITTVAWHPLGRSLAMGTSGGRVLVHDMTGGRQIREFRAPAEVGSVAWSRRGRHLAAGSRDGTLTVWEFGR